MSLIPVLGLRLRQEDCCESEASLGYRVMPCLKNPPDLYLLYTSEYFTGQNKLVLILQFLFIPFLLNLVPTEMSIRLIHKQL